ncbi:hypothetical protein K432DRAFT_390377 [Lepidopterella palustris CBS 459.81]|uniref:Uncharacterized protein n=1 Tax=Lepidopterella palustris CBS 459.81 TaxID=1314670 RepID=A0A8E2EGC2_9PEZI|nr:hypothetical protein K432DRAFT_390377 [Lepidopterella palustris CBS 459.81]
MIIYGLFFFVIYVFATAAHFGSQPECNAEVKYVVFGIDVPATNPVFRDHIGWKDVRTGFLRPACRIVLMCIADFVFCATAGAAAATTGAHVNGNMPTSYIAQSGAVGGVISSGIFSFSTFVGRGASTTVPAGTAFAATSFGHVFAVTVAVSSRVLGHCPNAILVSSVAAAAPLSLGHSWNESTQIPNRIKEFFENSSVALPALGIFIIMGVGFDALAGYTFVTVAHSHSYYICSGTAAATAGAVYGAIVIGFRIPQIMLIKKRKEQDKTMNQAALQKVKEFQEVHHRRVEVQQYEMA